MQPLQVSFSSYQFKRLGHNRIEVLNEGSYVIAEYSERTGVVKWQRVVLASQREMIERWLAEHFPVKAEIPAQAEPGSPEGKRRGAALTAVRGQTSGKHAANRIDRTKQIRTYP
jgi:hypothetical protein